MYLMSITDYGSRDLGCDGLKYRIEMGNDQNDETFSTN